MEYLLPFPSIPDHFATKRLLIRGLRMGDGTMINEAIRETFPALHQWMPWARNMPTVAETETYVRESAAQYRSAEQLGMIMLDKRTGEYIGSIGLHHIDWGVPKFEIGYWIRTRAEGYGYMTEAVIGITNWAFDHFNAARMEIRCDARNARSAAVAQRAGYIHEATFHHDSRDTQGALRNTLIFARWDRITPPSQE
jgi:ribosomal-protein-serine acetyltransferase